jgi:hypothetical protein
MDSWRQKISRKTEKAPRRSGAKSVRELIRPERLMSLQSGNTSYVPAHVFEMCFMFLGRNPRQTRPFCRTRTAKVQPLRTGSILMRGGGNARKGGSAPKPLGSGPSHKFAKKKPHARRGQLYPRKLDTAGRRRPQRSYRGLPASSTAGRCASISAG